LSDLDRFEARLGYTFTDKALLSQALTHRSYSKDHNERLEFLGDSLVNTLIAEQLFSLYSQVPEGHLSAMRSSLVRKETLAEIAGTLGFSDYLHLGGGALNTGGHRSESILADAYEAVVGAIYLDSDWQTLSGVVSQHFEGRLEGLQVADVRDAKSRLQELLQGKGRKLPQYVTLSVDGPGHAQHFNIQCQIENLDHLFTGEGSSRRAAEQEAAAVALDAIESGEVSFV